MPTKRLPLQADLAHLKHQAKDLLKAYRSEQIVALQRIVEFHPKFAGLKHKDALKRTFSLSDAYLTLAREFGFASWARLRSAVAENAGEALNLIHNERVKDVLFRQALDFLDEGDANRLKQHLAAHPGLIRQKVSFEGENYFTEPTLLEFAAENPVRQGTLPSNIVEVAELILDAGAKEGEHAVTRTLGLVASGRVAREAGVQGALINLLCAHNADPGSAMQAALAHGEFAAAECLLRNGANLSLSVAAAMGRNGDVDELLPTASTEQKQLGLSLAALHGHASVVSSLLGAGADPNRYNPPGAHSHCTPLHSAALEGHLETVKALVEGGAHLGIADVHHGADALGWAAHAGHSKICAFLRDSIAK